MLPECTEHRPVTRTDGPGEDTRALYDPARTRTRREVAYLLPMRAVHLRPMASVPFTLNADWIWLLLATGALYLLAVFRVRKDGWPRRRTLSFMAGIGVLATAFVSPLDNYDVVSLLAHTTQDLLIVFAAAPLIALGAPLTLLHGALPYPIGPALQRAVVSRPARFLTAPPVAWALFVGGWIATHEPDFFDTAMTNSGLLNLEHAVYLLTGFLFWMPVLSEDSPAGLLDREDRVLYVLTGAGALIIADFLSLARSSPAYRYYVALPHPWGRHAALVSQHRAALVVVLFCVAAVFVTEAASRLRSTRAVPPE
jgi:cytochrome c oxidase assembly factor CtaG